MRAKAGIFILICLLFLIGTAGAAGTPATLIVTNNTPWIVANGISTSTITVTALDSGGNTVEGVIVNLEVDPLYGTLSPSTVKTGPDGNATSTFSAKTKSGDPLITATNTTPTGTLSGSAIQHLDHDTPYYDPGSPPFPLYSQGNVSEEIPFTVSLHDQWGNAIDNRTGNHLVSLHVFSTLVNSDCAFNNSNVFTPDITLPLNADGTLTVPVRLTSKIGINYIRMDPIIPGISYPPLAYINVISQGMPVSMTGTISNDGVLPANGLLRFVIDYHLFDAHGNPMAGKSILIHTNVTGEQTNITHTADSNGLIRFYYGPKVDRMVVDITAFALPADNASLTNHVIAKFVADDPKNMVLTVSPPNMMSLDIKSDSMAYVRGTVVDMVGNPVSGQNVSFSLGSATGDPMIQDPTLDAFFANTDENGNAIVHLIPGKFLPMDDPNYISRAMASAIVTATWNGITKTSAVTWRNYPFLDVQVSANNTNLHVGDPVDITVTVTGNGLYREGGGKIAAILDLGNDQTIWSSTDKTIYEDSGIPCLDTEDYPAGCTPIDSAKNAANVFAENLLLPELTGNWIGVTTFGGKVDSSILDPQARLLLVQDKIASIVEPDSTSANFKSSILNSISTLETTQDTRPSPDSIRAVIILKEQSQGGANLDGSDISAIITEAEKHYPNTRIFTVYYDPSSSQLSDCRSTSAATDLQALSDGTNGKCYAANSADQLALAFKEIAELLKYAAGTNTQLDISFQNLEVNSNVTSNMNSQVFSYVPVGPFYTLYDGAEPDAITSRTRIMWPNATNSAFDQTQDWNDDHQLHFNIGVVNISEVWAATYTLRPEQSGFINLFNCTAAASKLNYTEPGGNNALQSLCIPDLYVKVDTNIPLTQGELIVSGLTPQSGNYSMEVPLAWNLKYTGPETVTETYWYSSNNGQSYVQFGSRSGIKSANGVDQPRSTTLSLDGLPDGSYKIEVVASVPGMPSSKADGGFTKVNQPVMIELK